MTVKELKEKLNQFSEDLMVFVPNSDLHRLPHPVWYVEANCVAQGINEFDGCLYICEAEED